MTLTVLDADSWYTRLGVQGRVGEIRDDAEPADAARLARPYLGGPYPKRERRRVSAGIDVERIEVERWHGWGAAENTDVVHH